MTPAPDPAPSARTPVTYVAYHYWAPAADRITHRLIPGEMFECQVTVSGRRFCLLFRRTDT